MTNSANRSIEKVLGIEGGYVNHPSDTGGKTKWGITKDVARKNGYKGEIKDLPLEKAKEIYHKDYWKANRLDDIAELNEAVAFEIFETCVHTGAETATTFFQRSLNSFNKGGKVYKDIKVDGDLGKKTVGAWRDYHAERGLQGCAIIARSLNSLQGSYYTRLAEADDKYEDFVYGWFNKRVKL